MDQMLESRIAQFENMCEADGENEMAHFSLAGAYAQAKRHADAARSYLRCVDLAPGMSKAYQLAAENLVSAGDEDEAVAVAEKGYVAAAERGDVMPRDALKALLEKLGRPVPEVKTSAAAPDPSAGDFVCAQTGRPGHKMERPPFKGPAGEWIAANISKETFDLWLGQGTKVINELRLDLSRDEDNATYDEHMAEFLGIPPELMGG